MEVIKLQFGSKFVVKIPREGKGEVFECRTDARVGGGGGGGSVRMPHLCPNTPPPPPHVQTLTALGLMSQRIDYYGY